MNRFLRIATVGFALASITAAATPCQAFMNLFQPRYTTAAPPTYPAYTGGIPQTVNYVPQTCYRAQTTSMPVTQYRPVSVIDPCTGCVQTIVQPTTAFVQQVRYIPYQSFRIVAQPTVVAAPIVVQPAIATAPVCGASCGLATCAPTPTYAAAPIATGCSTCGASAATYAAPMMAAPPLGATMGSTIPQIPTAVAPSLSAGTFGSSVSPSTSTGAVTPAPSLSPVIIRMPTTTVSPSASASPSTPAAPATDASKPAVQTESKLTPIPDLNTSLPNTKGTTSGPSSAPGLIDPNSRTTMRASGTRPWGSNLVNWPATKTDDTNAWRPTSR